jgi:hypothetical protein
VSVKLLGIGPDVRGNEEDKSVEKDNNEKALPNLTPEPMTAALYSSFCDSINKNKANKKLVVKAITFSIFSNIPSIIKMVKSSAILEAITPVESFFPKNELYAQEGTSKKWLQQVIPTLTPTLTLIMILTNMIITLLMITIIIIIMIV